jgi:copper chaperone CopZ
MKKEKYTTNINCSGCVSKIQDTLDQHPQIMHWQVNIKSKEKELRIEHNLKEEELKELFQKLGFEIKKKKKLNFF